MIMNTYQRDFEKFKAENPDRFMKMVEATRASMTPPAAAPAPAPATESAPEPSAAVVSLRDECRKAGIQIKGDEGVVELSSLLKGYFSKFWPSRALSGEEFAAEFERCLRAELGLKAEV
jgi:hypothetical protein